MPSGTIKQISPSKFGPGMRLCIATLDGSEDWLTYFDPLPDWAKKGARVSFEVGDDEKGRPFISSMQSGVMSARPPSSSPAPPAETYDPIAGQVRAAPPPLAATAGGTKDQWIAFECIFGKLMEHETPPPPTSAAAAALRLVLWASDVFTTYETRGRLEALTMVSQMAQSSRPPAAPVQTTPHQAAEPRDAGLEQRAQAIAQAATERARARGMAPATADPTMGGDGFDDDIPF